MKTKLILFVVFYCTMFGCNSTPETTQKQPEERPSSGYQYIETIQEQRFLGNPGPEKQLDAISINAENDTLAYIEAFKLFIQANKKNVDVIESGASQFDTPIDFKLLDKSGKDISKTIIFSTKDKIENEIFDQVFKIE